MRTCQACCRDFNRRRNGPMTCPFCGYNNAPGGRPRSAASLRRMEARREAHRRQDAEYARKAHTE